MSVSSYKTSVFSLHPSRLKHLRPHCCTPNPPHYTHTHSHKQPPPTPQGPDSIKLRRHTHLETPCGGHTPKNYLSVSGTHRGRPPVSLSPIVDHCTPHHSNSEDTAVTVCSENDMRDRKGKRGATRHLEQWIKQRQFIRETL